MKQKPLFVKDVPGVLYQKLVLLLLKVVVSDTFNVDKHDILFVVNAPDIVLSPDVNAAAVIPDQPAQKPASSKYLIDKIGLAVFLGTANCAP